MMLAETAPERVRRLVLVAPANPWSAHGSLMTRAFATRPGAWAFRKGAPALALLNWYFIGRMFGSRRRIPPDTVRGYTGPLRTPGTIEHGLGIVKSWRTDMRAIKEALPRIAHIPTLLIWGSRDRIVFPSSAESLRRHFARAELVIFDGVGHLPYEEVPDQFNQVIGDFLRRD
jgi:pimeloyl-ACP methyl ester carboxylesterase